MKKALTIDQQIARLQDHGMKFDNIDKAKEILLDVGYYRFGFYTFPFEITFPQIHSRNHQLRPGTTFKSVYDLYEFDTRLRRVLLNALDRIEVNVRPISLTPHQPHTSIILFGILTAVLSNRINYMTKI